jgi:type II secretory pathway pseudopilin PulG
MDMAMRTRQAGFTIAEVMTAMFILTVGLVSVLALFSSAITTMQASQQDMICRQKAKEALESIYTARESAQIGFANINNTTTSGGVFLPGFQNLTVAGPDGLVGTADDGPIETMVLPGPDGQLGTADDQFITLTNYTRQISITPLYSGGVANPDIVQLAVTICYKNPKGEKRTYEVDSLISRYR